MTVSLWSLAAYTLQLAALVTVAFAAMWMLRIRIPLHALRLWQAVLAIALLLPLAQPGNLEPSALQLFAASISAATLAMLAFSSASTAAPKSDGTWTCVAARDASAPKGAGAFCLPRPAISYVSGRRVLTAAP